MVLAAMPQSRFCTVLDVGGGHGQLAYPLARDGHQVTVLGSTATGAKRIHDVSGTLPIRFQIGNLLHLPFPDISFDTVVPVRLLLHVEDWQSLVAAIFRSARHTVIVDFQRLASIHPA